jgi:hypothetical protein
MKLSFDPSVTSPRQITSESQALETWYDTHPAVRRMWAIRDVHILWVIVVLEPTVDSDDVHPVWLAHSVAWARELRAQSGGLVELELIDESEITEVETDAEGDLVVAMYWRDPAFFLV